MTNTVVPFPTKKEPDVAYMTGPCICFKCKHEWVGRFPVGEHILECPNCGCDGVMKGTVWSGDDSTWTCNCSSQLFRIDSKGPYCVNCGTYATGWF